MQCLMQDLSSLSDDELSSFIVQRDAHADAALQTLLTRLFPNTSQDLVAQASVSLQDQDGETYAWNRRMRRRCEKSDGVMIHLFSGGNKRAFEGIAGRSKIALLAVDRAEDLLADNTFRYLVQQASRGRVKGIVASPPYRTFALCRYLSEDGESGLRPLRIRGETLDGHGVSGLDCREQAQRRTDDLLLMRTLILMVVAAAANRARDQAVPSCAVENPEDPQEDPVEQWSGKKLCIPDSGYATLWATPEWKSVEQFIGLQRVSFRQGTMGHGHVRPTRLCTNMIPDPLLINGCEELQQVRTAVCSPEEGNRKDKGDLWSDWSWGLQLSVCNMLWRDFREQGLWRPHKLQAMDAGFLEHLRQGHMPFRRDCKQCLQGGARHRQHRKVLAPQAWSLSLDTAGPFPSGVDESEPEAKYLIVAVLSVPILSTEGHAVTKPADRDPTVTVESFAESLDDKEWFLSKGMELEDPPEDFSAAELKEAKEAWNSWEKIVVMNRKEWMEEARANYLPKVEMVDFVYTEAVNSKKQQVVLGALSRIYARAISDGFSVQRIHTDRGREFRNSAIQAFCQKFGLHRTFAIAEEHQTNGRAEGAILRLKNKTRTLLQTAGCEDLKEWPLAAKLAAYQMRGLARKRLKMPCEPVLPFNTEVQILQRSWNRGVWESRTTTAYTKCPSSDSARGWVVRTEDGSLLTTSKVFPAVSVPSVKFRVEGQPVDVDAPPARLREKTKVRKVGAVKGSKIPTHPADVLAKDLLDKECWEPRHLAALALCMARTISSNERAVRRDSMQTMERGRPVCNWLSGAFTFSGMSGVRCDTQDHVYVTRYLTGYLARHTDEPFAGIGLSLNSDHELHRDVHNQRCVPNIVLPVVASGGGLWVQAPFGLLMLRAVFRMGLPCKVRLCTTSRIKPLRSILMFGMSRLQGRVLSCFCSGILLGVCTSWRGRNVASCGMQGSRIFQVQRASIGGISLHPMCWFGIIRLPGGRCLLLLNRICFHFLGRQLGI